MDQYCAKDNAVFNSIVAENEHLSKKERDKYFAYMHPSIMKLIEVPMPTEENVYTQK